VLWGLPLLVLLFVFPFVVFLDLFLDHDLVFDKVMLHLLDGFALSLIFGENIFEKLTRNTYFLKVVHLSLNKFINRDIENWQLVSASCCARARGPLPWRDGPLIAIYLFWWRVYLVICQIFLVLVAYFWWEILLLFLFL
jgi:hypothetical protein